MLREGVSSINEKRKKLKKNAKESVDMENENRLDPKYKTEICKSWSETKFCVYGNKCRFAHGKQELFHKSGNVTKYKIKDCKSFRETGICMYGSRCNFKHDERRLEDMDRSYYSLLPVAACQRRLQIFESLSPSNSPLNLSEEGCDNSRHIVPTNYHFNFMPIHQYHPIMARLY